MLTISKILPCNYNNSMYFEFTIDTNNDLPKNGIVTLENKIYVIADNSIAVNRTTNQYLKFTNGKWVKTLRSADPMASTTNIIKENGDYILPSNNIMGVTSAVVDVTNGSGSTVQPSYIVQDAHDYYNILYYAFCTPEEVVEFDKNATPSVSGSGYTLITCANVTEIPDHAFDLINTDYGSVMSSFEYSKNLISIGDYAFAKWWDLHEFYIGPNIESIGEHTFEGCEYLTQITVDNNKEEIINTAPWGAVNAEIIIPK